MGERLRPSFMALLFCLSLVSGSLTLASNNSPPADSMIGVYTRNDQIYINALGTPEGKPLTTGFKDHKPVWAKTGSMIAFFRIKRDHYDVSQWRNAIAVIHTDGTGYREVTSGEYHDYNPTWTRDGTNRMIFNRYKGGRWYVYMTDAEARPGEEQLISDPHQSEYAHTSLKDGRILITSNRDQLKHFVFMLTPKPDKLGKYDPVNFKYRIGGLPDSASISPNEERITYELNQSYSGFQYTGHPLVVADFNPATLSCSNPVVISRSRFDVCDLFPRWTRDGNAVIYQSNRNGQYQFYRYDLADKQTRKVPMKSLADYRDFCGEESPY